eukprot:13568770-Ditylum_brightwellii.AAC.1
MAKIIVNLGLDRLLDGGFHHFSQQTVHEVLAQLTDNEELQAVLAYNYGDYGMEPSRAPFLMHAIVMQGYLNGAYYPNGGPSTIVRKIVQTINAYDGQVLVKAPVQQILVDEETGNKVVGVQMKDGKVIKAPVVCSDAGMVNTAKKLLPTPDMIDLDLSQYNHDIV